MLGAVRTTAALGSSGRRWTVEEFRTRTLQASPVRAQIRPKETRQRSFEGQLVTTREEEERRTFISRPSELNTCQAGIGSTTMTRLMNLRPLEHRADHLVLEEHIELVLSRSGFTTKPQRNRQHADDPVEYLTDDDDDDLPAIENEAARAAYVAGDISDLTEGEDEDVDAGINFEHRGAAEAFLSGEMSDLTEDEDAALQSVTEEVETTGPLASQPGGSSAVAGDAHLHKKRNRRGGKNHRSKTTWTPEEREQHNSKAATAARLLSRHEKRAKQRREHDVAASRKAGFVRAAEKYRSTFTVESLAHNNSPYVSTAQAKLDQGGTTAPVQGGGASGRSAAAPRASVKSSTLRQAAAPSYNCNAEVKRLVRDRGYTYVANEFEHAQVFVDAKDVIYGVKPPQPKDQRWVSDVEYLYKKLEQLRGELDIRSDSNLDHTRGPFPRFAFGTSHGGGQKKPTVITPDWKRNKDKVIEFFQDPIVQRVCRHLQHCVFTWFPEVAKLYEEVNQELKLTDVFAPEMEDFNLPFAAHSFNLGPVVACWMHRDRLNWPRGVCPVVVVGKYDHTTSGHFIMQEPKVAFELRSGDIFIFLSSMITHGNAPLFPGETRMSWTCFMAGGLLRWLAAGQRLVGDLTTRAAQQKYKGESAKLLERGRKSLLTMAQLLKLYEDVEA